jgi:hypothetical protein
MGLGIQGLMANGMPASAPRLFCDACNERIDDASRAEYLWRYETDEIDDRVPILFAHKGRCIHLIEQRYGHMYSGELVEFITLLARNVGIDTDEPFPPILGPF